MEATRTFRGSIGALVATALLTAAALFILAPTHADAQTYGDGLYGDDQYGTDETEGGGGGGGSSRRTDSENVAVASSSLAQTPAIEVSLPRLLHIGMEGADVALLQTILKGWGYYTYPEITGYFGTVTRAAVIAFQGANGLEQVGNVGPLTRARILALTNGAAPAPVPANAITAAFDRDLALGATGEDVRALQRYLNSAGFVLATDGPGSPGNETTYFGSVTFNALVRFQDAHVAEILTSAGLTKGTGYFGPSTRSFIANRDD